MRKITVFLTVQIIATTTLASNEYITSIDSILADSALSNALIGLAIYDLSADSMLYALNADKLFSPASNLKLFTSAAALELLGPGYRFKTRFFHAGQIDNKGRLKGDLIITVKVADRPRIRSGVHGTRGKVPRRTVSDPVRDIPFDIGRDSVIVVRGE